jgi:hypothetical protein
VGAIASFHLVRHRHPLAAMSSLATMRLAMRGRHGVRFFRALGTGEGRNTASSVDPRRTALFAVWDDEDALDRFLVHAWPRATEQWHVRLRAAGGHGAWRGRAIMAEIEPAQHADGPVAIITRADIKLRSWRAFGAAGTPVNQELLAAPGLIDVVGIGEAPVGRLGTFSLWRDYASARAFAYSQPEHRKVIRDTRREGWYGEEMFARFQPYGWRGTWDGRDPLADVPVASRR